MLEIIGWNCDPYFMRHWSVFEEIIRLHGTIRPWQEHAPIAVVFRPWQLALPLATQVLQELRWWSDRSGNCIYRRDSTEIVREFHLNIDTPAVLREWLMDWHRRSALHKCGRIRRSLHRPHQPDLAQGADLPGVPVDSLCLFRGHVQAYRLGDVTVRHSALASGCTSWYKQKKMSRDTLPDCLCGRKIPSRPHLAWHCPAVRHLRDESLHPSTRVEERLFAQVVPETPRPPVPNDPNPFLQRLSTAIRDCLLERHLAAVATDGSSISNVAACAIVLEHAHSPFVFDVAGEDQTPYKAEVEALTFLCNSLLQVDVTGRLVVLVDCQAALEAARGRSCLQRRSSFLRDTLMTLARRGLVVQLAWVPSHGKPAPPSWRRPDCICEDHARWLNHLADEAARRRAFSRARGSLRQRCEEQRAFAVHWETRAIASLARIAQHYDQFA